MGEVREAALSKSTINTLDSIVNATLGSDKATVTLRDRASGDILYSYRGQHLMRPASNMKIITGATALAELGLDFCFKTELYVAGKIEDGALHGDIYI